jgi:tetratricopeptide (TPR) repeat protein
MHSMKTRTTAAAILLAGAAAGGLFVLQGTREVEAAPPSAESLAVEGEIREKDIALYELRAKQDPFSALDRARLASLYLQRSRSTGDFQDVLRAEAVARESIALREGRNASARVALASSLLAQHRFQEARAIAAGLVSEEPLRPSYRALLGEVQMELGDYAASAASFDTLAMTRKTLAVAPRAARLEEIRGRTHEARKLLAQAAHDALARGDLPREQMAWFQMRRGDLELRAGKLRQAERAYRDGLAINPEDHRILAGLARVEVARGRHERALALHERSIAQVLDPVILAEMSEIALAMRDSVRAREYARVAAVAASQESGSMHRAWSLFQLDHGSDPAPIAAEAAADLRTRRDVYGYDLLAWALHRQGRHAEARRAMAGALRMGTRDASLLFHAGMIERALGNDAAAARHLEQALEIHPGFHPRHPATARAVLDSIGG